jgi:uncharacterized membrane protein (DUF485 family)
MDNTRVTDKINVNTRRDTSKMAIRQMLAIFENAASNGIKPKIAEFSAFKQDAKEYWDDFKKKREEMFNWIWSVVFASFFTFLIALINLGFDFSFLPRQVNYAINGLFVGLFFGGMAVALKYVMVADLSQTGYVRTILGHLTKAEAKYVQPLRQVLFDGISDDDYFELVEKFNKKLMLFLFIGIVVSSVLYWYFYGSAKNLGGLLVFVFLFSLWNIKEFHVKEKVDEK